MASDGDEPAEDGEDGMALPILPWGLELTEILPDGRVVLEREGLRIEISIGLEEFVRARAR